jgi:hypothetical protein
MVNWRQSSRDCGSFAPVALRFAGDGHALRREISRKRKILKLQVAELVWNEAYRSCCKTAGEYADKGRSASLSDHGNGPPQRGGDSVSMTALAIGLLFAVSLAYFKSLDREAAETRLLLYKSAR